MFCSSPLAKAIGKIETAANNTLIKFALNGSTLTRALAEIIAEKADRRALTIAKVSPSITSTVWKIECSYYPPILVALSLDFDQPRLN